MSTAKFTILKSRKNKTGRHPVVIRVTSGNMQKYIFTGYNCLSEEWDEQTETINENYSLKTPSKKTINEYLIKQKAKVQQIHDQFIKDGIPDYSPEQFNKSYGRKDKARMTVFKAFEARINELITQRRIGYANVFRAVKSALKTYRNGRDILLRDLTPVILEGWIIHLRDDNVKDISINNYLRTVRTLYLYAIKNHWVSREFYPFNEIKVSEFSTETTPRSLDNDKLMKVLNEEVFPDCQLAKDIFIFGFYGRGITFIDIAYLQEDNIHEDKIIYERKKLAKRPVKVAFPIRPEIKEILNKYQDDERGYLLPVLHKDKHITPQQRHDRIHKVRRQVNAKLRIIGQSIGIEGLSTYWSRHSYSTFMIRGGMSPLALKESLRHKNLKTTEIYIKALGLDAIQDIEDKIFKHGSY